jgi:hypothetical protein
LPSLYAQWAARPRSACACIARSRIWISIRIFESVDYRGV